MHTQGGMYFSEEGYFVACSCGLLTNYNKKHMTQIRTPLIHTCCTLNVVEQEMLYLRVVSDGVYGQNPRLPMTAQLRQRNSGITSKLMRALTVVVSSTRGRHSVGPYT